MAKEFRERVVHAIEQGEPIYFSRSSANGDNLIKYWTGKYLLRKLSGEVGLDERNISLRSYPQGNPREGIINLEDYREDNQEILANEGILANHLQSIANALDIQLTTTDKQLVPVPERADFYPWVEFDSHKVQEEGDRIRENISEHSSRLVVIAQFGSVTEKRFQDIHVSQIADTVKQFDPKSFVAAVSDKELLAQSSPPRWSRFRGNIMYSGFPYYTREHKKQLTNRDFGPDVDQAVFGTDINRFTSWFYAADTLVTTDSFAAWFGSGARSLHEDRDGRIAPNEAIVLYTIANPKLWKIPGATLAVSPVLQHKSITTGGSFDLLTYTEYYRHSINLNDPRRGILQRDIAVLKEDLHTVFG